MNDLAIKKISCSEVKGLPILVILVGESGSGKTTFVKMMDCEDYWFESSRAMVEALIRKGEQISHDTIHSFANKAFKEDPCWQVPNIIEALKGKKFLLLDGPRRIGEVRGVLKEHPRTLVIRIAISSNKMRLGRLQSRDKIDKEDFDRILRDEANETELAEILSLADLTIFNDGSIENIKKKAVELKETLLVVDNFPHS
jgi:dephospho-CoA kinase